MNVSNFKLAIGVPLSFHMVPSAFFESFIAMEKPPFTYLQANHGPIDVMRNLLVRQALSEHCSHLLFCDTDQAYHPKTITRLLSHKKPIVGALVYRRYPTFDPLMLRGEIGKYQTVEQWEPESLVEVDATGTGCLLIETRVFREIKPPWFRITEHVDGSPVGEDINFCAAVRNAGYPIYVDTSVPAGHISQLQITETMWRLYRRLNQAAVMAAGNGGGLVPAPH